MFLYVAHPGRDVHIPVVAELCWFCEESGTPAFEHHSACTLCLLNRILTSLPSALTTPRLPVSSMQRDGGETVLKPAGICRIHVHIAQQAARPGALWADHTSARVHVASSLHQALLHGSEWTFASLTCLPFPNITDATFCSSVLSSWLCQFLPSQPWKECLP